MTPLYLNRFWLRFGARIVQLYATWAAGVRSSLTPARPYIWRLSVLRRLMCPSTGPLLQGSVTAASTAREVLLQSSYKARQRMNASFLRALHPPAQRSQLAHAQEGAKVQNQFPHHREAGTLLFESVHDFGLCRSQIGAEFA